jgi:hypothetical protein
MLPEAFRKEIGRKLEERFEFLLKKLNVVSTVRLVREKVRSTAENYR